MKKSLEDLRFELNIYLNESSCQDVYGFISEYEQAVKKSEPIKLKRFGIIAVPLDLYNACKQIVPEAKLKSFERKLYHLCNTTKRENIYKFINKEIVEQFEQLYQEYSNVNTEEAKRNYN